MRPLRGGLQLAPRRPCGEGDGGIDLDQTDKREGRASREGCRDIEIQDRQTGEYERFSEIGRERDIGI